MRVKAHQLCHSQAMSDEKCPSVAYQSRDDYDLVLVLMQVQAEDGHAPLPPARVKVDPELPFR